MKVLDSDPREINVYTKPSVRFSLESCKPLVPGSQVKHSLGVLTPWKPVPTSPLLSVVRRSLCLLENMGNRGWFGQMNPDSSSVRSEETP